MSDTQLILDNNCMVPRHYMNLSCKEIDHLLIVLSRQLLSMGNLAKETPQGYPPREIESASREMLWLTERRKKVRVLEVIKAPIK